MRPEFVHQLARELQLPHDAVAAAIRTSHARIRRVVFEKRNGEQRIAYQPSATVKPILIWLRLRILSTLPTSSIATAFKTGASILLNATAHRNARYSVRVDIKNFFPSITAEDVANLLKQSTGRFAPDWDPADIAALVDQVCFDRLHRLPIGFPTSPDLANAVMYSLDTALLSEISDNSRYGLAVLTRYADDFVFSTDQRGACAKFVDHFRTALNKCKSPCLKINEAKTRYMSRAGGSTLITGLRINNQEAVRVHADYRDHVRLLLHLLKGGRLRTDDRAKLTGHLAFIQHVDPQLFTRLSFKYADQIAELRNPG